MIADKTRRNKNPEYLICILVPISLLSLAGLSCGSILLYGRLMLYAGLTGSCNPSVLELASYFGVSTDTVAKWLGELEGAGLIVRRRCGPGPWLVQFCWQPLLERSIRSDCTEQTRASLQPNEIFNPWEMFRGTYIPIGVLELRGLSAGDMLMYGLLRYYAAKTGSAFPGKKRLCQDFNCSSDTVDRRIEVLSDSGLIRVSGEGRSCSYEIVEDHPAVQASRRTALPNSIARSPANLRLDSGIVRQNDSADLRRAYKEEKNQSDRCLKESSSVEAIGTDAVRTAESTGTANSGLETKVLSRVTAFFQENSFIAPRSMPPAAQIIALLAQSNAEVEDLEEFLRAYKRRLKGPPGTWKHLTVSLERFLAEPNTVAAIKERREAREWDERFRLEREAQNRLVNTPVSLGEAARILHTEPSCWSGEVPHPLRLPTNLGLALERLARDGVKTISPIELHQLCKNRYGWCGICDRTGLVGSPLQGTVEFCSCAIGHDLLGVRPRAAEERNHAAARLDTRERLVAASKELQLDNALRDALERATAEEKDEAVILVFCSERDARGVQRLSENLLRIQEYLKDRRTIRVYAKQLHGLAYLGCSRCRGRQFLIDLRRCMVEYCECANDHDRDRLRPDVDRERKLLETLVNEGKLKVQDPTPPGNEE